ncbi:MAG: glutathione S-transferase family protein [Alphaproteobacteria bacterium]|nr:glutathione S-transferase family protein [Alphaproteobacteria bacterium]
MADQYRLFGSELSPYSVKVRSYLRYKSIPHTWVVRGQASQGEFQKHARLPLIPLLVTPQGDAMQDSTPLIEEVEKRYPEPALQPPDVPRAFLSALIEEYADEWTNKAMFHYRWAYEPDQLSASLRIASGILGLDARRAHVEQAAIGVRDRMIPRRTVVGSHDGTQALIEASFLRQLEIAEAHLTWRPYLFGGRPCLADLGWAAQLYELASDPTPQAIMQHFPHTMAWVARMASPVVLGEFEPWDKLSGTLTPLLQEEVARRYLPWADANMKAVQSGSDWFEVQLGGAPFSQAPQKYHVKSVGEIRAKARTALEQAPDLAKVLKDADCYDLLTC